jgi:nucleoside-diphosphate-sugar epimerase
MAAAKAAAPARILVTGATGMVGTALIDSLLRPGAGLTPSVARLVRHESRSPSEVYWDPYEMRIDIDKMEGFDAVVHLAGESDWNTSLLRSRVFAAVVTVHRTCCLPILALKLQERTLGLGSRASMP